MRATDDANRDPGAATPRRAGLSASFFLALAGLGLGFLAGWSLAPRVVPPALMPWESRLEWHGPAPGASDWPRPARDGESAAIALSDLGRRELRVEAPDSRAAAELAAHFDRLARSCALDLASRRDALRARAASELVTGPLPAFAPAAECAAVLRGWTGALRDLAGEDGAGGTTPAPDGPLAASEAEILRAAAAADPAALQAALAADAELRAARLEAEARAGADDSAEPALARWAAAARARADAFESAAIALEAGVTPFQRELVDLATPEVALAAERAIADPAAAWLAASPDLPSPTPSRSSAWPLAIGGGCALAGALTALSLSRRARRLTGPTRAGVPLRPAAARSALPPSRPGAWLQLVSGARRGAVAHAALEVSAHALARGERVLVVDAGRALRLEQVFGAEARLGLGEYLEDHQPALGIVQHGGAPRLFFMARGRRPRRPFWTQLDRFLEDVRPHFGRVVLALEPGAPRELGSMLAGRIMEGWWAGPDGELPRAARRLEDRLGIRFHGMDLDVSVEPSLELLSGRLAALATPLVPASEPRLVQLPGAPPEIPAEAFAPALVLDCDLQVRQRLRFLLWAQRLGTEAGREVEDPVTRS